MFPFWDPVIAPIIEAVGAKRIVEIGARRGATTERMLERLGTEVELHVIDPVPDFDPAEHERNFPGRYFAHRDLSHNVLPTLPAMDVALIDGDHNWYTVFHELAMLADSARRSDAPLPVLVMHDIGWPYGRRDMYYAPENIPSEFRQPYAQGGMHPNRQALASGGAGINAAMNNALTDDGDRNGVMTALEDFIAGYDKPVRVIVIPIYFGLAIVAEEELIQRHPALAAVLDWIQDASGKDELLELSESLRIRALLHQSKEVARRDALVERSAVRYLRLLEGALLDEHYIENEVRLQYLVDCIARGRPVDKTQLRDPVRHLKQQTANLERVRQSGSLGSAGSGMSFLPYSDMGRTRIDHLERCLDHVRTSGVAGDFVECGTGRGGGAILMRGYLDAYEMPSRHVWVADTFRVLSDPTAGLLDLSADLNQVRDAFARFDLLDERVRFLQGAYTDVLSSAPLDHVAVLRIGAGSGAVGEVLGSLYGRISDGGVVIVDDYVSAESREAVDGFRASHNITAPLQRVDWAAVSWQKSPRDSIVARPSVSGSARRAPLANHVPTAATQLSVVVVFYNMRREATRTLHSLSRAYQLDIDDLDYEVIVVENGSSDDEKLGESFVCSFGPEFRYLDLGDEATPSPADALNRGAERASGAAIAFMIDGAHVLTPGVLRHGMLGLETYAPSVVVTQQWYVGPGQQGDKMRTGYDRAFEDRLFDKIGWPADGYRLFEIGHFIGDRDWLDGLWESNCIFAPRSLLEQVGGFDESFSMAGGGYANLDFYERLGASPGTAMVTILGEGSFHQLHGGTTTNQLDTDDRRHRIVSYGEHYAEMRGRNYKGPGKTIHYVGTMRPSALRTRARRMSAAAFRDASADALPTTPVPMSDELRDEFIDAFWHTQAWRATSWFGVPVPKAATDLVAYQEIVATVRPDWIVETGPGDGGRAWFLASMCDLAGHGRVLSVGATVVDGAPTHPRITRLDGETNDATLVARVREIVGAERAVLVLGASGTRQQTMTEFAAYQGLVPVGSYVIVEDTVVNGHPVWPEFGPGPLEAVKDLLKQYGDFAVDPKMEKYVLTFNRMGFLKRLR